LDEDIGKLSSISSSPNIKFLESDINSMKNSMIRNQDVIDLWIKVQKSWQYLQPIFASDDIQKQMPKEYSKFENIDKIWVQVMSSTEKMPIVNEACSHQKIMENFQYCSDTSEIIIKNLSDYLNTKREAFPRFYFLPNEELLMILAQTRDVKMIQKFLNNCFEGIELLIFNEQSVITGMNSKQMEEVHFSEPINPLYDDKSPRPVEEWLKEVEKAMKDSLHRYYL